MKTLMVVTLLVNGSQIEMETDFKTFDSFHGCSLHRKYVERIVSEETGFPVHVKCINKKEFQNAQ